MLPETTENALQAGLDSPLQGFGEPISGKVSMAFGSTRLVAEGVAFDVEGGQHDGADVAGLSPHLVFQ